MPDQLQELIDKVGGQTRALIIGAGVLATALIFGLSRWATAPTWVPVYSNLPLESVGQLTEKLDQAGVKYQLERGGADITVASTDVARARVLLAKGGIPVSGRPGLELFDQPSWGMTDFTQKVNYRRALEGELERTIGKMRGIEAAQVHLALLESSSFRTPDKHSEASVVLKLQNGATPTPDVVQGISHLVASSVDGLRSEGVTVVDESGRLLSAIDDPSTAAGLTNRQLTVQRDVEGYLQTKAEQMVAQIVGGSNTRVQVSASVNFDKVDRLTQTVDPSAQATTTEQRNEITPGAQGGAASSNTAASYENSKSTETFSGAIGNLKRLSVAVLINDRMVGTGDAAKPQPRPAEELARIEKLVRSAVGIDDARGDVISVVSIPFDVATRIVPAPPKTDVITIVQTWYRPGLSIIALLLVFVVALKTLGALRRATGSSDAAATTLAAGSQRSALASGEQDGPVLNSAVRERVLRNVEADPEVAAKLIRAWMKEA